MLLRALAIQGSWNYETLSGAGFAFAILPALRRIHPDAAALEDAVRRHGATFNSHPYLAPLALGAVIRMESDGEAPELIDRFKAALRGTLGTLGDQLVWTGWRPLCMLLAIALLLIGGPWWGAVLLFLLLYNAGHVVLMFWGFSVGLQEGRRVAERIRSSVLRQALPGISTAGSFVAGMVVALAIIGGLPGVGPAPRLPWMLVATLAAAGGLWLGDRVRRVAVVLVGGVTLAGLALGVLA